MRTVATCGGLLLLLLVLLFMAAAFVVARRSPDAGPSPASISPSRGPPVRVSGLVLAWGDVDLGDVDPGRRVRLGIPWRRTDAGAFRVREVRTACGCLEASGLFG